MIIDQFCVCTHVFYWLFAFYNIAKFKNTKSCPYFLSSDRSDDLNWLQLSWSTLFLSTHLLDTSPVWRQRENPQRPDLHLSRPETAEENDPRQTLLMASKNEQTNKKKQQTRWNPYSQFWSVLKQVAWKNWSCMWRKGRQGGSTIQTTDTSDGCSFWNFFFFFLIFCIISFIFMFPDLFQ